MLAQVDPLFASSAWSWDWYAATVEGVKPDRLFDDMANLYGPGTKHERTKGLNRYDHTEWLLLDGEKLFHMSHGGNPWPNIEATSSQAPLFAERLRQVYPRHRPSRLDTAMDIDEAGGLERCVKVIDAWRKPRRLSYKTIRDEDGGEGNTHYFGKRESGSVVRLYDKGKQMARKLEKSKLPPRPNWGRIELETHPKGLGPKSRRAGEEDIRDFAARMTPTEAWILPSWGSSLLQLISGIELDRLEAPPKILSSIDLKMQTMVEQGAKRWLQYMNHYGLTDEEMGKMFSQKSRELEAIREERKEKQ